MLTARSRFVTCHLKVEFIQVGNKPLAKVSSVDCVNVLLRIVNHSLYHHEYSHQNSCMKHVACVRLYRWLNSIPRFTTLPEALLCALFWGWSVFILVSLLPARLLQIRPVCTLRNCFSCPSTCRYGATLTPSGHFHETFLKFGCYMTSRVHFSLRGILHHIKLL